MKIGKLTPLFSNAKSGRRSDMFPAYILPLEHTMEQFEINTPERAALFLAQLAHETGGFRFYEESMNYSPAGLAKTWPKKFANKDGSPNAKAIELTSVNQKFRNTGIASFVYANRFGNGDMKSGDGWRFRGQGLPMLTFYDNFKWADDYFNLNGKLIANPQMILQPYWGSQIAGAFWDTRGMNKLADEGKLIEARKRWNGGKIGLSETIGWYNKILDVLRQEEAKKQEKP